MDLSFLRTVAKPTRYTGGEVNEVVKEDRDGLLHVALAFPDGYEIGMSTLGLKILYDSLNAKEDIWAERVFMPMPDMADALTRRGLPLFGLESKRPLCAFDAVGFTLQFELTYTNILHMLKLGGIPVRAADRRPEDPVVVAGGPCAVNPEPLAPFMDAFFIGDGEEGALELCDMIRATRGRPRPEVLRALSKVEGTYVPGLYRTERDPETGMEVVAGPVEDGLPFPVRRRVLVDIRRTPFPSKVLVPHHEVVHDRYTIEIARGCSVGCRFCQAGYIYRPARERDPEQIRATVSEGLRKTGYNEVTLLSLNAGEYDGIERLVSQVAADGAGQSVGVAMPSLRVASLTEELASSLTSGRKSGFTLAPEAGTQRLRDVINKQVDEEDLMRASRAVFGAGWSLVKLYFMIGLPTETDEDVDAIVRLAKKAAAQGREAGCRNPQVTVSTSNFVPKPFTPFQWHPMARPEVLRSRQDRLKRGLRRPMAFKWHDVEASAVEGVFSLGDRRLAAVLEEACELGCRFDGWTEYFRADLWRQAFAKAGVNPEEYLYRERDRRARLPWDVIDAGVTKSFLWKEWERAQIGIATAKCGPEDCHGCGFFAKQCMDHAFDRPEVGQAPQAPRRAAAANSVTRYRLRFRKEGLARFIGHLDHVDVLVRALRRCGVTLAYSKGYHPMPKVELPPPLPLGVSGAAEWLEFQAGPLDRERLLKDLRDCLPAGLVPEKVFRVPASAPGLSSLPVQVYGADTQALSEEERAETRRRVRDFLAAGRFEVTRAGKDGTKTTDLRPRVLEAVWEETRLVVKMTLGGFVDFMEALCPEGAVEKLGLTRLGLEPLPAAPPAPAPATNGG
jgi:radical SAM family uncharacterized protein/radical SAM-linked protein